EANDALGGQRGCGSFGKRAYGLTRWSLGVHVNGDGTAEDKLVGCHSLTSILTGWECGEWFLRGKGNRARSRCLGAHMLDQFINRVFGAGEKLFEQSALRQIGEREFGQATHDGTHACTFIGNPMDIVFVLAIPYSAPDIDDVVAANLRD